MTQAPPSAVPAPEQKPADQGSKTARKSGAAWIRDLPQFGSFRPAEPDPDFHLIDRERLADVLRGYSPDVIARIERDLKDADAEIMDLFRDRDHKAAYNQNRYRKFQLFYIALAGLATAIGALQAYTLSSSPAISPWFGFAETLVALVVVFLSALVSREPPMQQWLSNRRRAEQMRREYFRYLMLLPPYNGLKVQTRRALMARRAADINRGVDPDEIR